LRETDPELWLYARERYEAGPGNLRSMYPATGGRRAKPGVKDQDGVGGHREAGSRNAVSIAVANMRMKRSCALPFGGIV